MWNNVKWLIYCKAKVYIVKQIIFIIVIIMEEKQKNIWS